MEAEFVRKFAAEWIAAWNARDLDRILDHYADDFEMNSPVIVQLARVASGKLKGKAAVGQYWAGALSTLPDAAFRLRYTLSGANSIVLVYDGPRGLSAEYFEFGTDSRVIRAAAHYGDGPAPGVS